MSIFGWDYPPGCNSTSYDVDDTPCELCGEVDCNCNECPVCGAFGEISCYVEHLMQLEFTQVKQLEKLLDSEYTNKNECRLEAEFYQSHPRWWEEGEQL